MARNRTDYTGQILDDRYGIETLLGEGGMGAVYRARHMILKKTVAVKFLHAEFTDNDETIRRFFREGQAAVAVRHKNIIDVLDVGISAEHEPYLVMEYLEGKSLAYMLKQNGPLSLPAACAVLAPVLSALKAAHGAGIVHRDLKPENVFLAVESDESMTVKLIDFGISKLTASRHTMLTHTGVLLGTPAYMAPEQIRSPKTVDHRVDLYATGVLMYEMLTGKRPFVADSYEAVIYQVVSSDPLPPEEVYEAFPKEAGPLIAQCLSKDPDERPQTAEALLEAIDELAEHRNRKQQLDIYTSSILGDSVATGNIGPVLEEKSGPRAEAVLAEMTPSSTPPAWSKISHLGKRRSGWVRIVGGLSMLLIIGGTLAFIVWRQGNIHTETKAATERRDGDANIVKAAPLVANKKKDEPLEQTSKGTVTLEINGAPEGARFTFNGKAYTDTPLVLPKLDEKGTLQVSAPGYLPWRYDFVPNKDFAIVVRLEPVLSPSEGERKSDDDVSDKRKRKHRKRAIEAPSSQQSDNKPALPTGFKGEW